VTPERFKDVPSPINLRDMNDARAWLVDSVTRRPCRPLFFATFAQALNEHFATPFSIVELGSGPGRLAAVLLASCKVTSYVAIDFSDAMHVLAKEHLGDSANRVQFATADFRSDWHKAYSHVDAVVTMQAAHEVRHKGRQPSFFTKVRNTLSPSGIFLFCDHYWEPGSDEHRDLYLEKTEQPRVLAVAGFSLVTLLLDREGMALYACRP